VCTEIAQVWHRIPPYDCYFQARRTFFVIGFSPFLTFEFSSIPLHFHNNRFHYKRLNTSAMMSLQPSELSADKEGVSFNEIVKTYNYTDPTVAKRPRYSVGVS
jgi:hypothetical protein